jgi:fermentation-respiration switch protein FrsA (DUF1100 family)
MEVNVVCFAYRGYSSSEGTPSEHGLHLDARAMLKWCETTNKIDKERVFLLGRSLGGGVAISLLHEMEQKKNEFFKGAVIENTFSSISDMADTLFPFLSYIPSIKQKMLKIHFDSLSKIRMIKQCPMLFVVGMQDSFVPKEQILALYDNKPSKEGNAIKERILVHDGNHNDTWLRHGEKYIIDLKNFFEKAKNQPLIPHTALSE